MSKKHCKCKHGHHHHHCHEGRYESRREERSRSVQNEFRSIQSSEEHFNDSFRNSDRSVWKHHGRPQEDSCQRRHVTVILNPGETLVVQARQRKRSR